MRERKLQRLKGYDYSKNNLYFITTCCQNRENFFCEIDNGEIILNSIGEIVEKQWLWLQEQYSYVFLDEFVIMPNHFHGILIIDSSVGNNTGGNGCDVTGRNGYDKNAGKGCGEKERNGRNENERNGRDRSLQHQKIKSVSELIGAFKTTSSKLIHLLADEQDKEWSQPFPTNDWERLNEYNQEEQETENRKERSRPFPTPPAEKFQWQKSFHDRIIRNDRELDNIGNYIKNNPLKWQLDIENQGQNSNEKQRNDYYDQIINE